MLLPTLRFSDKPKIYHQQECTANDHKLPTTVSEIKCTGAFPQKCTGTLLIRSVAEENFSLAESASYQQELGIGVH
jgi:hypothetical protein